MCKIPRSDKQNYKLVSTLELAELKLDHKFSAFGEGRVMLCFLFSSVLLSLYYRVPYIVPSDFFFLVCINAEFLFGLSLTCLLSSFMYIKGH